MVLSHARNLSRQLRVSEEKCLMSFARFQHRKSLWGARAAFWSRQLAETGQSVRSLEIAMQMCCRQGCRQLQAGSLRCPDQACRADTQPLIATAKIEPNWLSSDKAAQFAINGSLS